MKLPLLWVFMWLLVLGYIVVPVVILWVLLLVFDRFLLRRPTSSGSTGGSSR